MKYEWRDVFIVQHANGRHERLFGVESEAQDFCDKVAPDEILVINTYPVQFAVRGDGTRKNFATRYGDPQC